jgi:glycosyltransferase involved in cell wall biosynthesis
MAVNNNIKALVEKEGATCHLIPNFIDCNKFNIGKKGKDFVLVSVSNFYKVKAIDVLLKAMDIIVNKKGNKKVKLKIVGTGEYKDYYISIAKSLKLDNNV